ncbi:hypothetical protein C6503_24215 [Candidatus Poribacteria bacterium]|nr:MAG: hypothetical protein C6503_24215 [Candidatus Poribacteria bacterium]
MFFLRSLGIMILCLFLISITYILVDAAAPQTSDDDTDSYYVPANPNEPFDALNVFKIRHIAWAYAKNTDPEHNVGWYSVWAEVDKDRYRNGGTYTGILNEHAYKEKDRFVWQAALSMFSDSFCN